MTSIVVVDPNPERCEQLNKALQESNQFGRVQPCPGWTAAEQLLNAQAVEVVLVDESLTLNNPEFEAFRASHPDVGLVLLTEHGQSLDRAVLAQLGMHAHIKRSASTMEWVAGIAKALVNRLKPGQLIKFLK